MQQTGCHFSTMNKICSLVLALLFAAAAVAQQPILMTPGANVPATAQPALSSSGPGAPAPAAPPIVWSEDFANGFPAGWTIDNPGGLCPWVYTDDGSWGFFNGNSGTGPGAGMFSTTAFNGYLICDIASATNATFGQPYQVPLD